MLFAKDIEIHFLCALLQILTALWAPRFSKWKEYWTRCKAIQISSDNPKLWMDDHVG